MVMMRVCREPTCRRKIYLAAGVDQLFHNINMPFLGCNEKTACNHPCPEDRRRATILVRYSEQQ
jgi:hypothetical protein